MRVAALALAVFLVAPFASAQPFVVLYEQDFESPNGFSDTTGVDVSQQMVNELYGGQPAGFVASAAR